MNHVNTIRSAGKHFCIREGTRYDQAQPQDVFLSDGKVVTSHSSAIDGAEVINIDASQCTIIPGFVDLYSRCREPGLTRKGNINSESIAALSAGFTRVLCSPDTNPTVDSVATVEMIMHRSETVAGGASVLPMAALTIGLQGIQLSELATLQSIGCPAATQADVPIDSTTVLFSAMEYASSFDLPLILCARDSQLGIDGCAHTGAVATQLGLPTIPIAAESVALSRLIELCRETRCQVHISRISSARAVRQISDAKLTGLPISCDVGIHHLFYTDELLAGYDASFHSTVPFRSRGDRQALREGLKSGVIDAICSDHAPHDIDAALAPFPATEPGLSAYDWFMPLFLQLPDLTGMSLPQLIEKLYDAPLKILGMETENLLTPGKDASFIVLDTNSPCENKMQRRLSAGANNPLATHAADTLGLSPLTGQVRSAFHDGWATRYE